MGPFGDPLAQGRAVGVPWRTARKGGGGARALGRGWQHRPAERGGSARGLRDGRKGTPTALTRLIATGSAPDDGKLDRLYRGAYIFWLHAFVHIPEAVRPALRRAPVFRI